MSGDGHTLSRIFRYNLINSLVDSLVNLGHGLTARKFTQVRRMIPVVGKLRILLSNVGEQLILDLSHVDLQQPIHGLDGEIMEPVNGLCSLVCPDQRTGIDCVQGLIAKSQGEQLQLFLPHLADRCIKPALEPSGEIPCRLTMADNVQGGHHGRTPPVSSDRLLIPFSSIYLDRPSAILMGA